MVNDRKTGQSARASLLNDTAHKETVFAKAATTWAGAFSSVKHFWQSRTYRQVLAAVLLLTAAAVIVYVETVSGWTEALFLKVKKNIQYSELGCMPDPTHDRELVFVSCPVLYMHDFRGQAAGTFIEKVASTSDLKGLSMELQTEIYQWKEVKDCRGCAGRVTDDNGDCIGGSGICSYSFEKAWVPEAISAGSFHCRSEGQMGCSFPKGGVSSVQNTGSVPDTMRSFKKTAESVSIGTNPGRYYLSQELISQLPARSTPLLFNNRDALPTLPGKKTTHVQDDSGVEKVHRILLQTNPGSLEPDIGDVRSQLIMTDFYSRDPDRQVSVVAKQAPYINGEAHRTLVPWRSNLTSWNDDSELMVDWLDAKVTTFEAMVSEHRNKALRGVLPTIIGLRICAVTSTLLGMGLLCCPLAGTWLSQRQGYTRLRDMLLLSAILLAISFTYALAMASLPWFHYWRLCGGLLLGGSLLLFISAIGGLWLLDTRENLAEVLREHKLQGFDHVLPPAAAPAETAPLKDESHQAKEGSKDYGATDDASSAGMADVEEGIGAQPADSEEDNF